MLGLVGMGEMQGRTWYRWNPGGGGAGGRDVVVEKDKQVFGIFITGGRTGGFRGRYGGGVPRGREVTGRWPKEMNRGEGGQKGGPEKCQPGFYCNNSGVTWSWR